MLRGHVNARATPVRRAQYPPTGVIIYPVWMLSRAHHYREAHSHPDKKNAQIVSISRAPLGGPLSEIKQF
jgi:hypothetical protein